MFSFFKKLSRQGSNLDSSVPKTDVLPITPQDNHLVVFSLKTVQKYKKYLFCK